MKTPPHTANVGANPVHSSDSIRIESFDSFEQVDDIRQDWDEFVERTHAGAFMCFDWQMTWWQYYSDKRELRILIFRMNEKIVGILPLFRECLSFWQVNLRVVKLAGSDFSPVTVGIPIHMDYLQDVARHLLAELEENFNMIFCTLER